MSLRYNDAWIARGFALSEDLPLLAEQEFFPAISDTAAGAVDDARPDRWGERVIQFLDKPARLSLLEYLYFAGVGVDAGDSTLSNALSMSQHFKLSPKQARAEVKRVAQVVAISAKHFKEAGVSSGDIDLLSEQIDRPFLRKQREEFGEA